MGPSPGSSYSSSSSSSSSCCSVVTPIPVYPSLICSRSPPSSPNLSASSSPRSLSRAGKQYLSSFQSSDYSLSKTSPHTESSPNRHSEHLSTTISSSSPYLNNHLNNSTNSFDTQTQYSGHPDYNLSSSTSLATPASTTSLLSSPATIELTSSLSSSSSSSSSASPSLSAGSHLQIPPSYCQSAPVCSSDQENNCDDYEEGGDVGECSGIYLNRHQMQEIFRLKESKDELSEQFLHLQEEIGEEERKRKKAELLLEELEKEWLARGEESRKQYSTLLKAHAIETEQHSKLRQLNNQTRESLTSLVDERNSAVNELILLKEELDCERTLVKSLREKIHQLEQEIQSLNQKESSESDTNQSLSLPSTQFPSCRTQLALAKVEKSIMSHKFSRLEEELFDANQINERLEYQIQVLEQNVQQMEQQLKQIIPMSVKKYIHLRSENPNTEYKSNENDEFCLTRSETNRLIMELKNCRNLLAIEDNQSKKRERKLLIQIIIIIIFITIVVTLAILVI